MMVLCFGRSDQGGRDGVELVNGVATSRGTPKIVTQWYPHRNVGYRAFEAVV